MKKKLLSLGLTCILAVSMAVPVFAESFTVYFKDKPVYWEYGREGMYAYSNALSDHFEHRTIVGEVTSGWVAPGHWARARCFVGIGICKVHSYWDCRC